MVDQNEKELRSERERIKTDIEIAHTALSKRATEGDSLYGNYRGLHQNWWNLGNNSLLLGEISTARREFAASGLYARALGTEIQTGWDEIEKGFRRNAGVDMKYGIYTAVLSGHTRLISALGADVIALSDFFHTEREMGSSDNSYWLACTVACIHQRDDAEAAAYLDRYRPGEDRQDVSTTTELVADLHQSLLSEEKERVCDMLREIAITHEDTLANSRPWKARISHATAAHLLISRHRGMDITAADIDNDYVPTALDEYDIDDPLDLPELDYLPDESYI